jgi:hypothetical protein
VALIYEESKGLGAGHPEEGEEEEALDIGKDAMYHTFDMFRPDLAAAGHMLNMPETDPTRIRPPCTAWRWATSCRSSRTTWPFRWAWSPTSTTPRSGGAAA